MDKINRHGGGRVTIMTLLFIILINVSCWSSLILNDLQIIHGK